MEAHIGSTLVSFLFEELDASFAQKVIVTRWMYLRYSIVAMDDMMLGCF
jgi:hypothetical protein